MNCHIRLREERVRLGYNQTEFAGAAGSTQRSQTAYENGTRSPDLEYMAAIAEKGADVNYIVTGKRTPTTAGVALEAALKAAQTAFEMIKTSGIEVSPQQFSQMVGALLGAERDAARSEQSPEVQGLGAMGDNNMVATGQGIMQIGGKQRISRQRKMKSN